MEHKLVIVGAAGRMGKRITALNKEAGAFDIVAAVEAAGHPDTGSDAGQLAGIEPIGVKIGAEFPQQADVVIEFALAEASDRTVEFCVEKGAALVMGTTGLSGEQKRKVESAAEKIPVIYGTNMSVGMNVLFALVKKAAGMLSEDYDIEIIEKHHRFKKDAPSGSALTLAENICEARGKNLQNCVVFSRHGKDSLREEGTIGIHAIRAGDIAGEHEVVFSTIGETVTLSHNAHSRDGFARGALLAAEWLVDKKCGLYTMADVLGLNKK